MALVNTITFALEDYSGDSRTVRFHTLSTLTIAEMTSLAQAIATQLDGVTGALLTGCTVGLQIALPGGLKVSAVDDCDAERGINWAFQAASTTYTYTIRTPAALDANVNGESYVPTAAGNDFITVCLDGDASNEPTNQHGGDLTAQKYQKVTFQK